MSEREREVLLRIARASGPYRSAILSALDIPIAERLRDQGLAGSATFPDWWYLTDEGLRRAEREVGHAA